MVQCEKFTPTATHNNNGQQGKNKTATQYNTQKATSAKAGAEKTNSWGQFKSESHFKSLHHC